MNVVAFTCNYWHNEAMAQAKAPVLVDLAGRIEHLFDPEEFFISCGTYSDPLFNPLQMRATVVNSGLALSRPYNVFNWHYSLAAWTAAAWHIILNLPRADLIVTLDADELVGAVDFKSIIAEFMQRPELVVGARWNNWPDTGWMAWKPQGIVWFAHSRRCPNLLEDGQRTMLHEQEMGEIFKGKWWNPWPDIRCVRQDYGYQPHPPSDDECMKWPFVANASPTLRAKYPAQPPIPL